MEVGGIIAVSTVIAIIGGSEGCEFDYEMKRCHPGENILKDKRKLWTLSPS